MHVTGKQGCMQQRGEDACDEKAGMHTRRGVDACDKEQMHSMSMNKYYVESRG
jgi:hypothetical protein